VRSSIYNLRAGKLVPYLLKYKMTPICSLQPLRKVHVQNMFIFVGDYMETTLFFRGLIREKLSYICINMLLGEVCFCVLNLVGYHLTFYKF